MRLLLTQYLGVTNENDEHPFSSTREIDLIRVYAHATGVLGLFLNQVLLSFGLGCITGQRRPRHLPMEAPAVPPVQAPNGQTTSAEMDEIRKESDKTNKALAELEQEILKVRDPTQPPLSYRPVGCHMESGPLRHTEAHIALLASSSSCQSPI